MEIKPLNQQQNFREPEIKRAVAFFDGQNLFRHAMAAFGHTHPNFDPQKLLAAICREKGWEPSAVHFYTGIPLSRYDPQWRNYWGKRLSVMEIRGIHVTKRILQYSQEGIAREKGIDLRIGLDMTRLARQQTYDVAILFSQDRDFSEAFEDIKEIAQEQKRWIRLVCAFPYGPLATARWAIPGCHESFRMDEAFYNRCLDPRDYRPPRQ